MSVDDGTDANDINDSDINDSDSVNYTNNTINRLSGLEAVFGIAPRQQRPNYIDEMNVIHQLYFMLSSQIEHENDEIAQSQAIINSFQEVNPYKKVFDIENHKTLLKHRCYDAKNHKNTSCPIYMIEFKDDDEVVVLPCGHCYIPEAIYQWLEKCSHCCPFCRYELPSKEIKIDD